MTGNMTPEDITLLVCFIVVSLTFYIGEELAKRKDEKVKRQMENGEYKETFYFDRKGRLITNYNSEEYKRLFAQRLNEANEIFKEQERLRKAREAANKDKQ